MLNMEEEEQMHLLSSRQGSTVENSQTNPLNLGMVQVTPLHSYLWIPK